MRQAWSMWVTPSPPSHTQKFSFFNLFLRSSYFFWLPSVMFPVNFLLGSDVNWKRLFFFMIRRQMGHFQWCPWWRLGRWRWWWWWMRAEGNLEASRYVPCAPAVVEQKGCACPLLVAMPSIATFLIDLLAFAHSHQRPVIALDAIFSPLPLL